MVGGTLNVEAVDVDPEADAGLVDERCGCDRAVGNRQQLGFRQVSERIAGLRPASAPAS